MILKNLDNESVEVKVIGYQFPEINTPQDLDSNWLNISLNVHSKIGDWQCVDPSLTTGDILEIKQWFQDLSQNKPVKYKELGFIEPNLTFELIESNDKEKRIHINFEAESKPKSKGEEEVFIGFLLTNEQLNALAIELEEDIRAYPQR